MLGVCASLRTAQATVSDKATLMLLHGHWLKTTVYWFLKILGTSRRHLGSFFSSSNCISGEDAMVTIFDQKVTCNSSVNASVDLGHSIALLFQTHLFYSKQKVSQRKQRNSPFCGKYLSISASITRLPGFIYFRTYMVFYEDKGLSTQNTHCQP